VGKFKFRKALKLNPESYQARKGLEEIEKGRQGGSELK